MANVLEQLRHWLLKKRSFQTQRLEKDTARTSEVEESLVELPPGMARRLRALVQALPSHPQYEAAVREALSKEIAHWQKRPSATNNSLTVLSSPVSAVARILTESLTDWADDNDLALTLVDWGDRPADPQDITSKLKETLAVDDLEPGTRVAIIPNLGWCFLRTAEGLDGIDYLRDSLLSDRRRFWIVGSGQVGFQYINSVLQLQAHCGEVIVLPKLTGEQLQDWLMPVVEALDIRFDEESIQARLQDFGEDPLESPASLAIVLIEELQVFLKSLFRNVKQDTLSFHRDRAEADLPKSSTWEDYFHRLAELSEGIGTVALQLFVKSVHYEKTEEEEEAADLTQTMPAADEVLEDEEVEESVDLDSSAHRIVCKLPRLPALPQIDQNDLYILYSLLVHGDLTLPALAASLGEEVPVVNNAVQVLRISGLIEQQDSILKVNPLHYPRLKRRLSSNNFIVDFQD